MKKKIVCTMLALLISAAQVVSVGAVTEQELREEQAWTSAQLDATYSRIDELWYAKEQLESEISALDADLVNVMVYISVLENDIENKTNEIAQTQENLTKAQNAKEKQYEAMKKRIQYLYEKGGNDAWLQMMMGADNLADLLTRAEYTQKMYDQDRQNLDKYVKTIEEVQKLEQQYSSEKAELEEMHNAYQEQSVMLQAQIDERRAISADCDNEIAYAQQQANEYAYLLAEQTAELERMEAERIAAEEAARAAAEAAAAAAAAEAEEGYAEENTEPEYEVMYDEDGDVMYDEDGEIMYQEVDSDSEESSSDESTEDGG